MIMMILIDATCMTLPSTPYEAGVKKKKVLKKLTGSGSRFSDTAH